jgi:hypothetical protein
MLVIVDMLLSTFDGSVTMINTELEVVWMLKRVMKLVAAIVALEALLEIAPEVVLDVLQDVALGCIKSHPVSTSNPMYM